jgi:hypothetical protein
VIGAKAVKSFLTFAIVVFAASPACAQAEPARAEKAYLQCLLAHALDAPAGDEKSAVMMVLDKCAQELQGYMDECAATGAKGRETFGRISVAAICAWIGRQSARSCWLP